LDPHPSNYSFPISQGTRVIGRKLLKLLDDPSQDDKAVTILHEFIYPFLSMQQQEGEYSKWLEVLECYLAIANMTPDGNFQDAHELTKPFSIWKYICRGSTLYQGILSAPQFRNNAYK
jgi:hypothetical protein